MNERIEQSLSHSIFRKRIMFYTFDEVINTLVCYYMCGGDCLEDKSLKGYTRTHHKKAVAGKTGNRCIGM